ncbi:MAG: class I adenylate-forming enzyme family protein [Aliishimia sp.]
MAQRWHDLLDHQAKTQGTVRALRDSLGTEWSWSDFQAASEAAGDVLRDHGVKVGDRVVLLVENCGAALAFLYGTSRLGASVIPFNARQTPAELQRVLDHAEPSAIVMMSAVSQNASDHAERMGAKKVSGAFGDVHVLGMQGTPEDSDDVAVILYTTGTTGAPKGVMLTHDNLCFGGRASANLRWMVPQDLIYGVLPISHVFGLASVVTASSYRGAELLLDSRFDVGRLHGALQNGVTLLSAVPQMHALLMQYVKEQGHSQLGSDMLRYVSSGGAPLDPAWKRAAEAFYGVPLQNGYGMTETTAGISATQHIEANDDISCGPALPGVEVKVLDDAPEGELLTRGGHVMKGYFRAPEITSEVLADDGWFRTGDLGKIDVDGRVHILGRSKELIIHGGFNVYPPEVEGVLSDHPQVIQAAVVGHLVDGDEKVLGFCEISEQDKPDLDDLKAWAAEQLVGYKRPYKIILAEKLPAAATGKILKHKLKEIFADQI